MTSRPFVLFAAAAGPELGFGHLVRVGVLADALGVRRELSLRGGGTTLVAALARGWTIHRGRRLPDLLQPDLIVVDDPSPVHRERWVRLARRSRVPVVVIVDADAGESAADLVIDGNLAAQPDRRPHRHAGPAWSILGVGSASRRTRPRAREADRVLVALGGGAHVSRMGAAIARAIVARDVRVRVDLAAGFTDRPARRLPARCRWVSAPDGLADLLSSAGVAVVGGGLTLAEACALGTPTVAVPVVDAQRSAIAAAAAAGATLPVLRRGPEAIARAASLVSELIGNRRLARSLAARASRLVDGAGAARVAGLVRELGRQHAGGRRHAA